MKAPKQVLNHGLVIQKLHRLIKFNQEAWLRLSAKVKNDFEKDFKLMKNLVFGKTMENVRKYRNIKLIATEKRNCLVSESNYHTTKCFSENLLAAN